MIDHVRGSAGRSDEVMYPAHILTVLGSTMAEIWDLYNRYKEVTGETWERDSHDPIPNGRYHIIVSIWTITPDGEILITKRHDKKSFGGLWENTGGAVIAGETSAQAAYRELKEEVGLKPANRELLYLGDLWHPGNIVDVYMFVKDIDLSELKLQQDEVVDARLVTPEELEQINAEGQMVSSVFKTFCCYRDNMKMVLNRG